MSIHRAISVAGVGLGLFKAILFFEHCGAIKLNLNFSLDKLKLERNAAEERRDDGLQKLVDIALAKSIEHSEVEVAPLGKYHFSVEVSSVR